MNKDRPYVPLFPKLLELRDIVPIKRLDSPTAGIPAEYLHARAAQFESTLNRKRETARDRNMEPEFHEKPFFAVLTRTAQRKAFLPSDQFIEFTLIDHFDTEFFCLL